MDVARRFGHFYFTIICEKKARQHKEFYLFISHLQRLTTELDLNPAEVMLGQGTLRYDFFFLQNNDKRGYKNLQLYI